MDKRKVSKDDVEKLSRGQASGSRSGSRAIPHRLNKRERELFESAKKRGFLKLPHSAVRQNLINVYTLWCSAKGIQPIILRGDLTANEKKLT